MSFLSADKILHPGAGLSCSKSTDYLQRFKVILKELSVSEDKLVRAEEHEPGEPASTEAF